MKIAIINYTGTVGKTTMAAHLFAPRMNNAPIFAIETINETVDGLGIDVEKIRGDRFKELFKQLIAIDDAIIDVGASNVEAFLDGMARFEDSYLEIDRFIIPVTSGTKEQKETMSMISTLAAFRVDSKKIHIVFNRVSTDVPEEFPLILNYAKKEKNCIANQNSAIFENEVFDMLAVRKLTISDALADETDYKAKIRELGKEGDTQLKSKYADMYAIQACRHFSRNLKWDPSDFRSEKIGDNYCLRLPAFVLRPPRFRTPLRYALQQGSHK